MGARYGNTVTRFGDTGARFGDTVTRLVDSAQVVKSDLGPFFFFFLVGESVKGTRFGDSVKGTRDAGSGIRSGGSAAGSRFCPVSFFFSWRFFFYVFLFFR